MKRQLYNEGSPNKLEQLDISPEERALLEKVLEKDSMEFIRESDDDEVMEMLMLKQKRPEYQYSEEKPYTGPRDMRMNGGITSIPRQQYGFGSFVSSIAGGIGDVLGGAAEAVGDVVSSIDMEDIDKIAQVASFIPGPHQPFAQAYTAGRGSGIGGSDFGGFQIGGFTPSGGTFGTTSTAGPSLSSFNFMPQQQQTGGIFDLGSISQFMPTGGGTGGQGQPTGGIDPRIIEAGIKIGGNILQNKMAQKQQERNVLNAKDDIKKGMSREKAIALYGGAAVSAALAALAYESQQAQLEQFRQDREAYEARRKEKAAEYAAATRPEVTGRPETQEDVVRKPAMRGGIMDSRKGYMMGTEVPLRQNQVGITEMDFRESGGFVPPIGIKEKADDIPAMLSNNEFVFTADAVRAAGGGSVDKGAQKMYALMKQLEGQA